MSAGGSTGTGLESRGAHRAPDCGCQERVFRCQKGLCSPFIDRVELSRNVSPDSLPFSYRKVLLLSFVFGWICFGNSFGKGVVIVLTLWVTFHWKHKLSPGGGRHQTCPRGGNVDKGHPYE